MNDDDKILLLFRPQRPRRRIRCWTETGRKLRLRGVQLLQGPKSDSSLNVK